MFKHLSPLDNTEKHRLTHCPKAENHNLSYAESKTVCYIGDFMFSHSNSFIHMFVYIYTYVNTYTQIQTSLQNS